MNFRNSFSFLATLFAIVLFSSCGAKKTYTVDIKMIDYRAYVSKGFFITEANSVSFDYDPIGSISVRAESGYLLNMTEQKPTTKDKIHGVNKQVIRSIYDGYKNATIYEALDELYIKTKSSGGDGIINLKTEPIVVYKNDIPSITGYSVTGMAIKRK